MKTTNCTGPAVVLAVLIGTSSPAAAEGPATLWNFLGISQGMQKIRDATVNRRGNRPGGERKPPPKRIADPANLESPNKAIKTAAKIKADQDLAKQKIKAIKYLASVRCGCYPGVKEALLAALDDCSEEVRFEAAVAFCVASGDPCDDCDKGSCCDAQVMAKLREMASGQDEKCCYKEPSAQVRAAAKNALDACKQMIPPAPARPPAGKEYAPETPPGETAPEEAIPGAPPAPGGGKTTGIVRPVSLTTSSRAGARQPSDESVTACCDECAAGDLCDVCPRGRPATGMTTEEGAIPFDLEGAAPGEEAGPSPDYLAGAYGAAAGPQSVAPNMIGDFFGGGSSTSTVTVFTPQQVNGLTIANQSYMTGGDQVPPGLWGFVRVIPGADPFFVSVPGVPQSEIVVGNMITLDEVQPYITANLEVPAAADPPLQITNGVATVTSAVQDESEQTFGTANLSYWLPSTVVVNVPNPGAGGVVGRTKIAENTSTMPRDRLLFNYSFFDNVPLWPGGIGVHRFTPGLEKTFWRGWASLEMKIPMAVTLDNNIIQDGGTDLSHGEFGNLGLTFKRLLLWRRRFALAAGLTVSVPTADDVRVNTADGTPLVLIRNESVYLQPFVGFLWTPNDRFFAQGFLQYDVASNGNPVSVNLEGNGLRYVDDIHDTTFQYLDVGVGWWSYRGSRFRRLTGLAWTAELHWNRSLKETDVVTGGNFVVGDFSNNVDLFNLTLGAHLELYDKTTITLGYSVPLGGGRARQFDGEFRLLVNRRFGPQSRLTRTPR